MPSRIELLQGFIAQRPDDPFPRYGLAMELKNGGQLEAAWRAFEELLARHEGYVAAYLHAGNTLVGLGRPAEAKAVWQRGIGAATKAGDAHARGELQGALDSLT